MRITKDIKNIYISSQRRSGTHFIIDSIINNFSPIYEIDKKDTEIPKFGDVIHSFDDEMALKFIIKDPLYNDGNIKRYIYWTHCNTIERIYSGLKIKDEELRNKFKKVILNMKIIYIYRDVRDVATSKCFLVKDEYDSTYAIDSMNKWNKTVANWLRYSDNSEIDILYISYESLKNNYEETLKKISHFINIPLISIKDVTISSDGEKNSLLEYSTRKFRKGIIGDWKNYFGKEEIKYYKENCLELMTKLYGDKILQDNINIIKEEKKSKEIIVPKTIPPHKIDRIASLVIGYHASSALFVAESIPKYLVSYEGKTYNAHTKNDHFDGKPINFDKFFEGTIYRTHFFSIPLMKRINKDFLDPNKCKIIVSWRDIRDIATSVYIRYFIRLRLNQDYKIPHYNEHLRSYFDKIKKEFSKFLKDAKNYPHIIYMRSEDMIYDFNNTIKRICEHLNCDKNKIRFDLFEGKDFYLEKVIPESNSFSSTIRMPGEYKILFNEESYEIYYELGMDELMNTMGYNKDYDDLNGEYPRFLLETYQQKKIRKKKEKSK